MVYLGVSKIGVPFRGSYYSKGYSIEDVWGVSLFADTMIYDIRCIRLFGLLG